MVNFKKIIIPIIIMIILCIIALMVLTSKLQKGEKIKLKIMAYEPDTYYSAGAVTLSTIAE